MLDFETKIQVFDPRRVKGSRRGRVKDLETAVASIVCAIFQGDPRSDSDLRDSIADFSAKEVGTYLAPFIRPIIP